eukprot:481642-Pelagomonas_calceolata.AAC.1
MQPGVYVGDVCACVIACSQCWPWGLLCLLGGCFTSSSSPPCCAGCFWPDPCPDAAGHLAPMGPKAALSLPHTNGPKSSVEPTFPLAPESVLTLLFLRKCCHRSCI